jgi:PhoH-like ATPase
MPLPKAPTKPATSLKLDEAVLAKAARPKKAVKAVEEVADTQGSSGPTGLSGRPARPAARVVAPPTPAAPLSGKRPPAAATSAREDRPAATQGATKHKKKGPSGPKKIFVLDTNVLMHDPMSLFRFEEHDVYLPMTTLEELDGHKKGMSEVARNVRTVSRNLDALIEAQSGGEQHLDRGIALDGIGHSDATGRLYFQTEQLEMPAITGLATFKADNLILGVVRALKAKYPQREIVLVSKDINIRIKAHAMGLEAEDYFNDQVIDDADLLYTGSLQLPADFWETHGKNMESWQQGGTTFYRVTGPLCTGFHVNQFLWDESATPLHATVTELTGRTAVLQVLRDYSHTKNAVWGITARNREQAFALSLLMNPEIDFVTLLGQAGTGKTLLALAAGLAQTLETKVYSEIIVTRATVSIGEDIGFLPGTEEEKMQPWMGALEDNLEVLNKGSGVGGEWGRSAATDLIKSRIKVKSMNFMRGRTFISKFLIIDEAQNLTPKQMKALITRAGPGTKVVCMGNIAQIDTPYLTEGSSGLTYTVDRFKGWSHGGHVTLQRGERSRLADFAADIL